uniref:Tumor necrosis factor alpha-induced protein 8 n=1 Tax=Chinchilla lanigera TaxID=34839 RepID=A0A8C2YTZ9_CHILA
NSKNLAVQAQKKILGKMVSKSIATTLIDDTSSEVLDELYRVTKEYTQNKKEAERIIKNLIKTVIKLAILYRNNQFNQDELALMEKFKKKVHQLAMTVVSFHQVDVALNFMTFLKSSCWWLMCTKLPILIQFSSFVCTFFSKPRAFSCFYCFF